LALVDIYNHCRTVYAHFVSIVGIIVPAPEVVPVTVMGIIIVIPVIVVPVIIVPVVGSPGIPVRRIVTPVPG
jgi:hypothetical protein